MFAYVLDYSLKIVFLDKSLTFYTMSLNLMKDGYFMEKWFLYFPIFLVI